MTKSMHSLGRLPLVACAVTILAMAAPAVAHAQDDAFKDGYDARERQRWAETATQMRRAIAANPQESARKVEWGGVLGLGRKSTEYLPYYFLGEALFNQQPQDCIGAIDAWSASEKFGAVRTRPDFLKTIQSGYDACDKLGVLPPAKFETAQQDAARRYEDVKGIADKVVALGQSNSELWRPELRAYERASAVLETARTQMMTAARTRSEREFAAARTTTEEARTILAGIDANLNAAIESRRSAESLGQIVATIIGEADALDRSLDTRKASLTQAMIARHQEGRQAVERAREGLREGQKIASTSTLNAARAAAQDALTTFRGVLDELTRMETELFQRRLADALTRALDAFSLLDNAVATLEQFLAERPNVLGTDRSGEREAVEKLVTQARRRFEAARKSENLNGINQAAQLATTARDQLNLLIEAFGPLTIQQRGVHQVLEEGARHFLAGAYQQAVTALERAEQFESDVPFRVHFHLFRAASFYALFVRSRESDGTLRARALEEVEHCRAIDSSFEPDPRWFSPRFISFYRTGRAADPQGAAEASTGR